MVEEIVRFAAQLHSEAFVQPEILRSRKVLIDENGAAKSVETEVSERIRGGYGKGAAQAAIRVGVEPVVAVLVR